MPNTETITVYLLKEHIASPADALKEGSPITANMSFELGRRRGLYTSRNLTTKNLIGCGCSIRLPRHLWTTTHAALERF